MSVARSPSVDTARTTMTTMTMTTTTAAEEIEDSDTIENLTVAMAIQDQSETGKEKEHRRGEGGEGLQKESAYQMTQKMLGEQSFLDSPIVEVVVGTSPARTFMVHKAILCSQSDYFVACLKSSSFEEGPSNKVVLEEDDPVAFQLIVEYLYNYRQPVVRTSGSNTLQQLIAAYALADKLFIRTFCNQVVDAAREACVKKYVAGEEIYQAIESRIPQNSPLCEFLTDQLAYDINYATAQNVRQFYYGPSEGLEGPSLSEGLAAVFDRGGDIVVSLTAKIFWYAKKAPDMVNPYTKKGCVYHSHEPGEVCSSLAAMKTTPAQTSKPRKSA